MNRAFRATYRLQLTPELGFRQARALAPYLRDLGISHLYLSPSLQAREGSTHGYDVVDPRCVSDVLGGEDELRALASTGLGVVLDIVPNHMATGDENPFWRDPELRRTFFDVDARTGFHRRFFDIGELGGVRVEDEAVFETLHAKTFELVRDGVVDGLRIDHVDGLANPREYLARLRRAGVEHVWVEKILEPGEELRDWPVDGTTGYEFLNDVMRLFVEPSTKRAFTDLYGELTGERRSFAEVAFDAKLAQAQNTFEPELRRLHEDLSGLPNVALALASFHVYRTYAEPERGVVDDADRAEIARAAVADSLERILLLEERGHDAFVRRFQQTTGPVMAKGVEDTAFYRYNRFVALNEVGGDPGIWSLPVDEFHLANVKRFERFPLHLLTTFTHDTKRSPDVRARLVALTSRFDEWASFARRELDFDDANEGYLALQTLVGAPVEQERTDAYLEKAFREAKTRTNWLEPDAEWERRVQEWARTKRGPARELSERVKTDADRIALGMLVLKLTCPGVPDVYQGDELETLALVDPDNRRPVDWEARRRALTTRSPETRKLHVTRDLLALRARLPDAFASGYMPLDAPDDVCAFVRGGRVAVSVGVREGADARRVSLRNGWREVVAGDGFVVWER